MIDPTAMARLRHEAARFPCPLVFATVSGAHLYGFPSADSDYDLRGCHLLPLPEVVGLGEGGRRSSRGRRRRASSWTSSRTTPGSSSA